jgi:hypothetical protein
VFDERTFQTRTRVLLLKIREGVGICQAWALIAGDGPHLDLGDTVSAAARLESLTAAIWRALFVSEAG